MTDQKQKAEQFRALHQRGVPLVLFNIWDVGSARAVVAGGAQALATGSWSVARANGFEDGERIPRALALDNLRRIVAATPLPVTIDLESGYGETPDAVAETIALAHEAGAIGCNLEDSDPAVGRLRDSAAQAERLRAARRAAGPDFFINARTDVFFPRPEAATDEALVEAVLERAEAYRAAGADGLFVPGLADLALIARLAEAVKLPLNIMAGAATPPLRLLAEQGVARISHGPGPYLLVMKALEEAARAAHAEPGRA